jgi:hypothetical protein
VSQGKIAAKVPRKKRDWHDIMMTIISTDVPEDEIMRMTPRQRKEAREAQDEIDRQRYWTRHREREAAWLSWAAAPNGTRTWRAHCERIGRMDLYPAHCLERTDGPGFESVEVEY